MTPKPRKKAPPKPKGGKRGYPMIPIDIKKVETLASRGLTQQQICDALGICVQTLINRKKSNIELMEAIKRGTAQGIAEVVNSLFEAAVSGNVQAIQFFLKNRAGWKDKVDIELENSLPAPLIIEVPCIDVTAEPTPTLGNKAS